MSKGEDYARRFDEANKEFIAAVENCPDERWTGEAAGEERSVATVAHHVASSHKFIAERTQMLAAGEQLTPPDIDAMNAEHASEHPNPSKDEVVQLLRQNGARAAEIYRAVPDEGLDKSIEIPGRGKFSVQDMMEMVAIGHPRMHMESLKG
ncbi:MAG TPA: DinB family protein [Dehalococcoidia bacterium]|nr:DinB family protein [Dehalococcoidia bacterium]